MSEPLADPQGSEARRAAPPPERTAADDALVASLGGPTDDTPTIITRNPLRPAPAEGSFSDGLRGRHLAHFELIEPIGVGGMAAVLRARDTQLDRCVALKILPPEMAADPENVRRFHQEARSAARLDHENIARVFFCGEDQRLHFIAFEFVEGNNLRTILERRGRLPVGEALHYMLQVAAGLTHASQRGVVHRDIKPSNIIITPNGRAKLVDMGLARSMEPRHDNDLTQSGVTLGTFDYISPEQALEPRDADVRSDIYSLGCTFYHVLTGRPPVPEGTAARKLHHHQHVKPPDPRQFVPDLPHDVAVILDRMIAKQPRNRYQSAEELVHHLLLAARKLGASPDVPEGLLTVEAALPNRPGGRPLLLAVVAVVAVVALILGLDRAVQPDAPAPPPRDAGHTPAGDRVTAPSPSEGPGTAREEKPPVPPVTPVAEVATYRAPEKATPRDLVEWLNDHRKAPRIELYLADLDLSNPEYGAEGLVVRASQQVTIRPRDPGSMPTIRFRYDGKATPTARVALAVHSKDVTVEGVRFVLDLAESSDTEMIGLLLQGGQHYQVESCEFVQAQAPSRAEKKRLASVVAVAERRGPELTLKECCFLGFGKLKAPALDRDGAPPDRDFSGLVFSGVDPGGQDAVVRRGPVKVLASDCAFGPHLSTFRLEGGEDDDEARRVTVRRCSVLAARRSAVFDLPAGASAALDVSQSLFSRLDGVAGLERGEGEGDSAVLLRQADDTGTVTYKGKDNRYHDLDGYWAMGGERWQTATWGNFRQRMGGAGGQDEQSRVLLSNPWAVPPDELRGLLEKRDVWAAFRVQPGLKALRRLGTSTTEVVGAERLLGKPCVPGLLPALNPKAELAGGRILVVEPDEPKTDDGNNLIYSSVNAAVLVARPGDTILIRHNGELEVDPIRLDKTGLRELTVRPFRRFHPVLTLNRETSELDTALFRVHDGKLRLEGLEFRLRPSNREASKSDAKAQTAVALVALVGDGDCVLKNCLVTLDRARQETALALATLNEAGKVMKLDMPPARTREQGPRLALENCLVRGEGDLLWSRASRPCELNAQHTLAALKGSLLNVEVPADAAAPPNGHKVQVVLTHATTYLGGHLIRLAAGKDLKGLVPVCCTPKDCVFVPAGREPRALVHLDGPETDEKGFQEKLRWVGEGNAYGAFANLLDQQPPGSEVMSPPGMKKEKWQNFSGDTTSSYEARLATRLPADLAFTELEPKQFLLPEELGKCGAELSRLPLAAR